MLLSISTGWRAMSVSDGAELIETVLNLGADALELGYHITESVFERMRPIIERERIAVSSIHNFFPSPDNLTPGEESGELYLFTSSDPDERRLAVKYTVRAMEIAAEIGARAVVLHLGHIPMVATTRKLKLIYDEGGAEEPSAIQFLAYALDERKDFSEPALDNVLICLDHLNVAAEKLGVFVGIENRYHLEEVPNFDELSVIFREFPVDSMVRYWHDVGHAEVNRNLGYGDRNTMLETFESQLIGMHLHDVNGHRDHASPGSGTVDWELIKRFIKPDTIKVLELAPQIGVDEARAGMAFLRQHGFD